MISAQKLFEDHTAHVVLLQLLEASITETEFLMKQCNQNEDAEIEALSLSRLPLSVMPRAKSGVSPTERVANQLRALKSGRVIAEKESQLHTVLYFLQLYETLMKLFTEREKWFIEQYYNHNLTITQLTEQKGSPFYQYDRSSVWRFKRRLLKKADTMLNIVYEQKGYNYDS